MIERRDVKGLKFGGRWRIHNSVVERYEQGGKSRNSPPARSLHCSHARRRFGDLLEYTFKQANAPFVELPLHDLGRSPKLDRPSPSLAGAVQGARTPEVG